MYKYKVSVVMAVYNVEDYIRESINSIIAQNIGFAKNVQIILVDDGSIDRSGEICDEFAQQYPDNIVVIHKENGGSASARKAGVVFAEGKYVNFLDPDDTLSRETLKNVCNFFDKKYDQTDAVAIPIRFFGTMHGPHPLNNKFELGTRVINLENNWKSAQMSLASAFFKNEVAKQIDADTELVTSEDAKEIIKILTDKMTLGVVKEARYNYRRYGTSQVSRAKYNQKWYITYLEHYTEWAINYCKNKLGYVPMFVQYTLMYDLQWRFRSKTIEKNVLSEMEKAAYKEKLFGLLKDLSIEVVFAQTSLYSDHKIYLSYKIYNRPPEIAQLISSNGAYFSYDKKLFYSLNNLLMTIHKISIEKGLLHIEGTQTIPCVELDVPRIIVLLGDKRFEAVLDGYDDFIQSVDEVIGKRVGFVFEIPLSNLPKTRTSIRFALSLNGVIAFQNAIKFGKHLPITKEYKNSYYAKDGFLITGTNNGFCVQPTNEKLIKRQEKHFVSNLRKTKSFAAKKAAWLRVLYRFTKKFFPSDIWLVTDKADRADDNGEAFFTYLCENREMVKCHPVFAISKSSPDYKRIKKIGRVVPYMSWRHKFLHLLAQHTISAYSHDEITSPFFDRSMYYGDILQNNKIIFLQHGIIKDDLSIGLNRRHKNYSMFVTSAERERNSVLECNYGYNESQVVLTGLPRYDALYNNPQKKITIMPTWLRSLFGDFDVTMSRWQLLPGFEESDYFVFYNSLLNSDRLLTAAEEMGYKIQFMAHPVLFPYLDYFKPDPRALVLPPQTRYRDIFAQSSLITTDFSSVAFDFAYLRKPLIYTQFEQNHYEDGYFDYEEDGFGEVEKTLEGTVDRLIEYMKNGCSLKDKYRDRIDAFYAFSDKNNCRRVYEAIINLDKG